jgi:hypothetical protein
VCLRWARSGSVQSVADGIGVDLCCPRARDYVTRRRAEGMTTREIRRCLKRYIARELFHPLTTAMAPTG